MIKKRITLLILIFLVSNFPELKGQMVYVPDSMLKISLLNLGFIGCMIGDSIDSSCPQVLSEDSLYLGSGSISDLSGIEVFTSLVYLDCNHNHLTSLPNLPASLKHLNCNNNLLTSLPSLPVALVRLYCEENQLISIPPLPSTLIYFHCDYNHLTTLPSLPTSLKELWCGKNNLTTLPPLSLSLILIDCDYNNLSLLPALPPNLLYFSCDSNHLSSLPLLNDSIKVLTCNFNQLSSLPPFPGSLTYLHCNNNLFSSLVALPPSVIELDCSYNQLTNLPLFPSSLRSLYCSNNQLTSIPVLPDLMNELDISNNPNIFCLPKLSTIQSLNFSNCPINCLPNYGGVVQSTPPLSGIPLCDVMNANGCEILWNISGKVYIDLDSNCQQSINDKDLMYSHINLFQNGSLVQQVFTGWGNFYSFDVNNFGIYKVEPDTNIPFTSLCPPSNNYIDTISISDSLFSDNDFALKCKSGIGIDVGVWSITSQGFRPGFESTVKIHAGEITNYYGVNCSNGVGGILTVTINGNTHYVGTVAGSISPSSIIGNVITYNIADFGSIHSNTDFNFVVETDSAVTLGSTICIDALISSAIGDNNLTNNFNTNCFTVRSSFDPNDKIVYPEGIIDTSQHWLTYTINFQNTGTATAENIYLLDTISNQIDLSSFQLLATSHPSYVQIFEGRIVKFNFPNINLIDSFTNEPLSHGYVQYKVKMYNHNPIGTQIHNKAYIYFDFNVPVVTNTTTNTIEVVNTVVKNEKLQSINVWPVPFDNSFILETQAAVIGSYFSIVNLLGDEMKSGKINLTQLKIDTDNWTSGIYFLRIEGVSGNVVRKLIKN